MGGGGGCSSSPDAIFQHVLVLFWILTCTFAPSPWLELDPGAGFLPWLSRVTPLATDLAVSLLPTCGCVKGPGDVNLSTAFDGRRVVCM